MHKPVQYVLQTHFNLDARRLEFIARFILTLLGGFWQVVGVR
jgi:hypothetical protein